MFKTKHESEPQYNQCVPPCKRFLCAGDTHSLCVLCLGARHAEAALEGADCPLCESLPLRVLRSRKALFSGEGSFIGVPRGAGPASAEAERRRRSWASQRDLVEGSETSESLSPSSPVRSHDRSPRSEARPAVTSPRAAASALLVSSSEEVDTGNVEHFAPPLSPQYEELVEVITRAAVKLSLDWSAERPVEPQRGKLDERFLRFQTAPPHRSLPFFPDLHTEVSRSWGKPFSARLFVPLSDYYGNVAGTSERGYRAISLWEQPLPRAGSSYREAQKESVATRVPPRRRSRGGKKGARSKTSQPKPDLRTVLQARRSSTKKP